MSKRKIAASLGVGATAAVECASSRSNGYATTTLAPSKGRLMRCTVDGLRAEPLGNDPYARPPRSRQSLTDSFLRRRGYRRPTKTLPLAPGPRKPGADSIAPDGASEDQGRLRLSRQS